VWRGGPAALGGRNAGSAKYVSAGCSDPESQLHASARGRYGALRELDASAATLLLAEPFPPDPLSRTGLGFALRARIGRATLEFDE